MKLQTAVMCAAISLSHATSSSAQTSQTDLADVHGSETLQVQGVGAQIYECKKVDQGRLGLASVQWRAVWWAIPLSNSVGLLKPSAE